MRKAAGSVPRPNESGPLKQAVEPRRFGPVEQKPWRMPSEKSFESVLSEAVTPTRKPAWSGAAYARPWLLKYSVTALMPVCSGGG